MTMLSDFLNAHGLKVEQVVVQSAAMEHRHIADRDLSAKRRMARAAKEKKPYSELNLEKPKALGRGLSKESVQRAVEGTPLPRLLRKKIARAVNALLVQQKKEPADARKLFGDVKSKKQPKKK